uniref:Uncharacterized protein n=1 Tax=Oryza brachyantha TaxID=4533 RepID=J3MEH5_ORYBR
MADVAMSKKMLLNIMSAAAPCSNWTTGATVNVHGSNYNLVEVKKNQTTLRIYIYGQCKVVKHHTCSWKTTFSGLVNRTYTIESGSSALLQTTLFIRLAQTKNTMNSISALWSQCFQVL